MGMMFGSARLSPFAQLVSNIVGLIPKKQMMGSKTNGAVAFVQHKEFIRNRSMKNSPRNPMG
jgi:hypothetical protein